MVEDITVRVKILSLDATLPTKAKPGDVAFDLYSMIDYTLSPSERLGVPIGISLEIPSGYEGQVRPRSGLALKQGVTVLNSPGTIDSGYRGEVKCTLINLGDTPFEVKKGDRIGQLAIRPVPNVKLVEVDELTDTERGAGGFGSTGM